MQRCAHIKSCYPVLAIINNVACYTEQSKYRGFALFSEACRWERMHYLCHYFYLWACRYC